MSNFTEVIVELDGIDYPSVENAYQASKTINKDERKQFENITSGQAKRAGKKVDVRNDWDKVKLEIMEDLNRQKYNQEPFKSKLIQTGNQIIQEGNTWGDTFWGICRGVGKNNLGKIIMKIRSELQNNDLTNL